ncbi:MAG: tryptophan--tRNA ligase [Symbiobacteriaceae bacterium]|nr:tryptophan--tRNA ligase [Symbiobacteriaceae bacterium]
MKKRILTGDRPTGKLHLGHYLGSLENRVKLQDEYDTLILVADIQALTTNWENPEALAVDVRQAAEDNLAVGVDPDKVTFVVQSMIPQIAELTVLYSNFVSVNVLRHNPTIKSEAAQRGYNDLMYGFLGYPVSQAADITFCKAHVVPVGEDQVPHLELTRKIVRRFNELYKPVLIEPEALVGRVGRLVGLDGNAKMSKSMGNCIFLSDDTSEVLNQVNKAVTDPARIRASDPGHPDICTVYAYHLAFNDVEKEDIAERCRGGLIGCVACKKRLAGVLNDLLEPVRERRDELKKHPGRVDEILRAGTAKALLLAEETMREVREALQIAYFS